MLTLQFANNSNHAVKKNVKTVVVVWDEIVFFFARSNVKKSK